MNFLCSDRCCKCCVCRNNYGPHKIKSLEKHIFEKHAKQYLYCAICNVSVKSLTSLKRHELTHMPDSPKEGSNVDANVNLGIMQTGQTKPTILVHQKKLVYPDVKHRIKRPRSEDKSKVCSICGKIFAKHRNLKHHYLIHTEERPYQCQICDKTFRHKTSLHKHKSVHSNEKLYRCDLCGNSFKSLTSMRTHIRKHSGERRYKCDICDKRFLTKPHLKVHSYVHATELPFKCTDCPKQFYTKFQFQKHSENHMKKRRKQK
ncbi:gastrula zinc finger protein XlCGF49.1-like [Macrosteles quadrilineatus]|uniref:gastrula zinc finger protein XlCGF49.1-like n=1 Tax=Macrosteles quadrilineatus TaxID=74068 RepID=UPI0023E19219|nr:gastrula zinc finger protein XlCGF49.1-like [Macrosteles quadrilineatus]